MEVELRRICLRHLVMLNWINSSQLRPTPPGWHVSLVQAIRMRDPDFAEKKMREHVNYGAETVSMALELLQQNGITPTVVEYLKIPPTAEALKVILDQLGMAPRDLMRKKEDVYAELNLDDPSLSDDALIDAMTQHPILIERPIVLANGKAALGRPPEQVLDIL